jgi:C1A family cysteine protease
MTDDPQDQNRDYNDDQGGDRPNIPGGGGGLGALLPLLLTLFRGKGIIVLLVLAAGAYFLLGRGGCNMNSVQDIVSKFSQSGYSYSPDEFNKASIYEGLDDEKGQSALPESVSLLKYAPPRGDQGQQGSCVAWSSAYAAQTVLFSAATHEDPASLAFSPSYLYNQIRLDNCQGSYVEKAMEAMQRNGGVPMKEYPYDDRDCDRAPSESQKAEGRRNVIHGFTRLTQGDKLDQISVRAVKEHLAHDAPVVIGMMVGQSFMQDMMGKELWQPQGMDAAQIGMGGHAMCVIGYDDRKYGGAFQIMNSWTENWGNKGVAWVRYGDFKQYVKEAYGLDPLPKRSDVANIPLECTIAMVENAGAKNIELRSNGGNTFQTVSPIKVGTRFKVSIKNATECYIYIFGQETDGSSYVLFPYLNKGETVSKYSPYCGITGYRLFPKDKSLEADSIGSRDYIAVVVSREQLDYTALNEKINQASGSNYANKVNNALRDIAIASTKYNNTADGSMYFKVDANNNKAVASIVAFDKVKP